MRGHIKQRSNGSWSVVIYLGVDEDGKKRYKWHTVHGTKRDAQRELNRLLHELNIGTYVEPSKQTLGEYLDRWLEAYSKASVSAKTHERYVEIVQKHLKPALGKIELSKLRPMQIQSYYSKALQEGRRDGTGGLSAQTIVHHHRVLRKALQDAVKWELISKNPAASVQPPRAASEEMKVLTSGEVGRLLDACKDTLFYIPVLISVTTGMRRGEVFGLRWQDVDLESGVLSVRRSMEQTKDGISFKEPKTSRGKRAIVLPKVTIDALKVYKKAQDDYKAMYEDKYQDNDLVCAHADGSPIAPNTISGRFARMVTKAEVTKIRFHDLRHTHATICLQQGLHPKIVQERLGHATVGITLDVYSHVVPSMQEEAARKLNDVFGSRVNG